MAVTLVVIVFIIIFVTRVIYISINPSRSFIPKREDPARTCIIMGSGGHTGEMMHLINHIPKDQYKPRHYIIADTDTLSAKKVWNDIENEDNKDDVEICYIPRSREVGQSWISTVWSTSYACWRSGKVIWDVWPDIIICNGPGTCIPIILVAHILKILNIKHVPIIFVESFARVNSLSLTGKILYMTGMADVFIVQWEQLKERYNRAMYCGRLV